MPEPVDPCHNNSGSHKIWICPVKWFSLLFRSCSGYPDWSVWLPKVQPGFQYHDWMDDPAWHESPRWAQRSYLGYWLWIFYIPVTRSEFKNSFTAATSRKLITESKSRIKAMSTCLSSSGKNRHNLGNTREAVPKNKILQLSNCWHFWQAFNLLFTYLVLVFYARHRCRSLNLSKRVCKARSLLAIRMGLRNTASSSSWVRKTHSKPSDFSPLLRNNYDGNFYPWKNKYFFQ